MAGSGDLEVDAHEEAAGQPVAELLALHDVAAALARNPDTACTMPGRSGHERVSTKSPDGPSQVVP